MKITLSIEEHGLTHTVTGEPKGGDDWVTYDEVAEIMSGFLSGVYGYKIYLDAHTDLSESLKTGLSDDGQDVDFIKP